MKHAIKLLQEAIDNPETRREVARDCQTALNILRDTEEFNKSRRVHYFCDGTPPFSYDKTKDA